MAILNSGEKITITVPAGKVLAIVGARGTSGSVHRLNEALGGNASSRRWGVGEGSMEQIAPLASQQRYLVTCALGNIDVTVVDAAPQVGSMAAVITGTGIVGQPLTATLPFGVVGTLQFTKALKTSPFTKSNISGSVASAVNSLSYTVQSADAPYNIGCDASSTVSSSNVIVVQAAAPSINFVAMLDSLTAALGATDPSINAWPVVARSLLPSSAITVRNVAVSGDSTTKALERWDSTGAGFAYDSAKELNVLGCLGGTNDAPLVNLVPIYRRLREIYRRARVTGYDRVIAFTIPSRDDATASYSADTLPLNIAMRELFDSDMGADALVDLAADPRMSTIAAVADGTFYSSDRLHFVDAGYAGIGHDVAPVLANVIAAPGVRKMAPPTWSAFDTSKYLSISNSGRTLTWTAPGFSNAMARAYCGAASGKYAWETVLDDVSQTIYVGMCNSAFEASIWDDVASLIESVNAIGYSGADVRYNNAVVATLGAPVTGDVIQHAVDLTARRYWIRKAGGQWNGSASADPSTGVGGIDISALGAGMLYPAGGIFSQGGQLTSRFAASQMTLVPSGFVTFG